MRNSLFLAAAILVCSAEANADNPIQTPYQQFGSFNCVEAGDCAVAFPIVTKETLILHASCTFGITGTDKPSIAFAYLGRENGLPPSNTLAPFLFTQSDGGYSYGINAETYLFYASGEQPQLHIFGDSSVIQNLSCTVSGYQS